MDDYIINECAEGRSFCLPRVGQITYNGTANSMRMRFNKQFLGQVARKWRTTGKATRRVTRASASA